MASFFNNEKPATIAYHGGIPELPNNTFLSYKRAIGYGADIIFSPAALTSDRDIVVAEDKNLNRISDGSGYISDYTLEELKRLDACYRFRLKGSYPYRGRGIRFFSLREMLKEFPDQLFIINPLDSGLEMAEEFCGIVRETGSVKRVLLYTVKHSLLKLIESEMPQISTSFSLREFFLIYTLYRFGLLSLMKKFRGDVLVTRESSGISYITSRILVQHIKKRGGAVYVTDINSIDAVKRGLGAGVDGLITDNVKLVADYLKNY